LQNIDVIEGDLAVLDFSVVDPDGDAVSISIGDPFDNDGFWQTGIGDAGVYDVQVKVTDGVDEVIEFSRVTVEKFNYPPEIYIDDVIEVNEGDLIQLEPEVFDADGDALTITYRGFMDSSTYQTDFGDAGTYVTTIRVTDGKAIVEKEVEIIINKINRPPMFNVDNIFK
jgi:hypothetical protein